MYNNINECSSVVIILNLVSLKISSGYLLISKWGWVKGNGRNENLG